MVAWIDDDARRTSALWSSQIDSCHVVDAVSRDDVSIEWMRQASAEHASVASFAAFTLQLMTNGAPPLLLKEAAQAAADEVRHAELCFALAGMHVGGSVEPTAIDGDALAQLRPQNLSELAEAVLVEAAVAEFASVVRMAARVDSSGSKLLPVERDALLHMIADELRHVALAWRTLSWAVTVDPLLAAPLASQATQISKTLSTDKSAELIRSLAHCLERGVMLGSENARLRVLANDSLVSNAHQTLRETFDSCFY